ncbi:unannotated protein [freshwater metagenome]|uniref:Unannotated protein n=1 Tax=freshwater metagenome TaxID=449393 RepID=A0A6J7XUD5_9ZZZZ|nr:DUF805 domain-containing protein [Actinomycetota bacterium]
MIEEIFEAVEISLRKFADFSGKASRREFWFFNLFLTGALFFTNIVISIIGSIVPIIGILAVFINLASVVAMVPYFAAATRRMHDVGKSGWWVLVPFISFLYLCLPSSEYHSHATPSPSRSSERFR